MTTAPIYDFRPRSYTGSFTPTVGVPQQQDPYSLGTGVSSLVAGSRLAGGGFVSSGLDSLGSSAFGMANPGSLEGGAAAFSGTAPTSGLAGTSLSSALGGGLTGVGIGGLAASLTGGNPNAGMVAGGLTGAATSGIFPALALSGPWGWAAAGLAAILGGQLFKKKPTIGPNSQAFFTGSETKPGYIQFGHAAADNGGDSSKAGSMMNDAVSAVNRVLDQSGVQLTGGPTGSYSLGEDKRGYQAVINGQGTFYKTKDEAIQNFVKGVLQTSQTQGGDPGVFNDYIAYLGDKTGDEAFKGQGADALSRLRALSSNKVVDQNVARQGLPAVPFQG